MESSDFEILPVIRKYVTLKKRGSNYIGLCPFHSERTPSFTVSEAKNIFKCFGCGKGGDAVQFVMEIEDISINEAIEKLRGEYDLTAATKKELRIQLEDILDEFNQHIASVNKLMNFDRIVLDFCIESIKRLDERIKNNEEIKVTNVYLLPTSTIQTLEGIKENDSLRNQYESIFNQCLVLLVSYFSTICKEIFTKSIDYISLHDKQYFTPIKEDIKLSFEEISKYDFNLSGNLGQVIVDKKNISFQDMQSIVRSFEKYLLIEQPGKDNRINNIILAQAARHCIVHTSEITDEKFFHQIRNSSNRDVLKSLVLTFTIEQQIF